MFSDNLTHGRPFSLEHGQVIDSAIISPHNSFTNISDEYSLTVTFPDTGYVNDIGRIFRTTAKHGFLPHENKWKVDNYTIRCTSLVQPRTKMTEELTPFGDYNIRVKTDLHVGEEYAFERVLLVMIQEFDAPTFDVNGIDF